jgi:hypothetical protein
VVGPWLGIEGFVNAHDQDGASRRARAQQVALFRYQLICPALEAGLSTKTRGRIVRAIAERTHQGPFGKQHCDSRDTLDRWIRRYRAGGFEALAPSPPRSYPNTSGTTTLTGRIRLSTNAPPTTTTGQPPCPSTVRSDATACSAVWSTNITEQPDPLGKPQLTNLHRGFGSVQGDRRPKIYERWDNLAPPW